MIDLQEIALLARQADIIDKLIIRLIGNMNEIQQVEAFLKFTLGSFIGGEVISAYFRNKTQKKTKLANGHLIKAKDILDILGNDGLILSKDIQLKEKFDYEGSVIFGATGSKKTTSTYVPNLLSNNLKGSLVVSDPKSELFTLTSGYQEKVCGRKVLKFSPLEPQASEHYNLLATCKDNAEVLELASSLLFNGGLSIELSTGKKSTSGAEWIMMAEPLFAASLIYCKALEYPYNNIEFALNLLITLNTKELDALFSNSKNPDCIKSWNTFKVVQGADRTEGSIKITLASNLKLYNDYRINQSLADTTFNFESFRKEPTILYLTYPENKASYIAPFTAPFFTRMLNSFIDTYTKDSLPVTCLFDEFANIVEEDKDCLQYLKRLLRMARACGIHIILCTQRPDKDTVPGSIKNNVAARVALYCSDKTNSRIIIDNDKAAYLSGNGHGILHTKDDVEFRGFFLETEKAKQLIKHTIAKHDKPIDDTSGVISLEDYGKR
jgi:type IV secretory pathway TraG/TraD family ATPase VirD4